MRICKLILAAACCSIVSQAVYADIVCKGKVVDANDKTPLIGATIVVKDTYKGTATDFDGNFTLTVPDNSTLQISYVGFMPLILPAKANMGVISMEYSESMLRKYSQEERESMLKQGIKCWGEKRYKEAYDIFLKLSNDGYVPGMYYLGTCYWLGKGVEQDRSIGFDMISDAAEEGYAQAQYILGMIYHLGDGVEKDLDSAKYWYRKAAEQGHEDAREALYESSI